MANPRKMTAEERAQLEKLIASARRVNWKEHFWLCAAALTVLPALYSGMALVLLAAIAWIAGYPVAQGAWRNDPVTYYGAFAVPAAIWLLIVISQLRWSLRRERDRRQRLEKLETDLTLGVVRDEMSSVTGVKLLREPEHGMILFCIHLSNGKTFVVYDYGSVDTEGKHNGQSPPTLAPGQNFHLLTFPVSKEHSWSFSGTPMSLSEPIELALSPDDWPDDESWCRVKWENIERHYGPKKPRQAAASRRS